MKKSGKRASRVVALAISLLLCASVYASLSSEYRFVNKLETSRVDIDIEQYRVDRSGEEVKVSEASVMPGQTVSYIPRVINTGTDSFVRVSFKFETDGDKNAEPVSLEDVGRLSDEWVQKGECFYRLTPMKSGEKSDVFREINVPESWYKTSVKSFRIIAEADAIQAKNFSPDFDKFNPWGNVEIEVAKKGELVSTRTVKVKSTLDLTYTAGKVFECSTSDLFSSFDILLPGDEYEEVLPMSNKSGRSMNLYFRTDNDASLLQEKTHLEISCDGKSVYEGSLTSENLSGFIKLARIPEGASKDIRFRISLPEDAGNSYSNVSDNVVWIFAAREDAGEKKSSIVKTGDAVGNMLSLLAAICTLMVIIIIAVILKGGRNG